MAYGRFTKYLPPVIITVVVIIAVVLLVALGRLLFIPSTSGPVDTSRENLLNTSLGHSVRMTVRGPIVANELFHSYSITVTPESRNLTTYVGYLDTTVESVNLDNNIPAYTEFVSALDKADLARGTAFEGDHNNVNGICATGNLISFDIIHDGDVVKNLWTSTCSGSRGSLNANARQLGNLFRAQIPDARKVISNIGL